MIYLPMSLVALVFCSISLCLVPLSELFRFYYESLIHPIFLLISPNIQRILWTVRCKKPKRTAFSRVFAFGAIPRKTFFLNSSLLFLLLLPTLRKLIQLKLQPRNAYSVSYFFSIISHSVFFIGGQYGADEQEWSCKYTDCYWLAKSITLPYFLVITILVFFASFVLLEVVLLCICMKWRKRGR